MSDLLIARLQMWMLLAFHITLASFGVALPLLTVIAEALHLKTGSELYRQLARRWAKATAILFAVGEVTGTVLSFSLGLLWPEFMAFAGAIVGLPFSLEGFAFFFEAIFLGIYLYGWSKVSPRVHLASGIGVAISGAASAILVITANSWMNTPQGFTIVDGQLVDVRPLEAMFNPGAIGQGIHMVLAAYMAVGFGLAGVHAFSLLRDRRSEYHRRAMALAMGVGLLAGGLQLVSGHHSATVVAEHQPVKLAAMEAHWETERGAAYVLGGWPDEEAEETRWAIRIPYVLSLLSYNDPMAEVKGLKDFPEDERPPVWPVHFAFQIMVFSGVAMIGTGLLGAWLWWRRREVPISKGFLRLAVAVSPLGFIAIQAGWIVTEVGRQPWVITGYMRTSEAVTPMTDLWIPFVGFAALYTVLGVASFFLVRRLLLRAPDLPDAEADHAVA